MFCKICDNCNGIAALEHQNCIELKFTYDRETKHFCSRKCLDKYLSEEEDHEKLLYDIKEKIIEILGTEKIDEINKLVNNVEKDKDEPYPDYSGIYHEKMLREEIVNQVLRDIINDE